MTDVLTFLVTSQSVRSRKRPGATAKRRGATGVTPSRARSPQPRDAASHTSSSRCIHSSTGSTPGARRTVRQRDASFRAVLYRPLGAGRHRVSSFGPDAAAATLRVASGHRSPRRLAGDDGEQVPATRRWRSTSTSSRCTSTRAWRPFVRECRDHRSPRRQRVAVPFVALTLDGSRVNTPPGRTSATRSEAQGVLPRAMGSRILVRTKDAYLVSESRTRVSPRS